MPPGASPRSSFEQLAGRRPRRHRHGDRVTPGRCVRAVTAFGFSLRSTVAFAWACCAKAGHTSLAGVQSLRRAELSPAAALPIRRRRPPHRVGGRNGPRGFVTNAMNPASALLLVVAASSRAAPVARSALMLTAVHVGSREWHVVWAAAGGTLAVSSEAAARVRSARAHRRAVLASAGSDRRGSRPQSLVARTGERRTAEAREAADGRW